MRAIFAASSSTSSIRRFTILAWRRRNLVTTTTTTTAAAARQPTHAAASVVVVGSGRMGEIRASLLRANPRFHLLGIVDTHLPGAKRLADKYGVNAYGSLEAALDDIHPMGKPLDGVIVSTPTSTHPNIIRQASDAQVAVFTEKPVGETAQDIEATFRYASNIAVCCGFQRRFDPAYVAAKQNLHLVGKPVFAHIFFADHPGPPKEFLLEGGNIFMDLSAHDVDYITDALSQHVVSVYATGTSSDPDLEAAGVHDNATCVLHLSQGKFLKPRTTVTLFMSRFAAYGYDQRCEIFGTEGSVSVQNVPEHTTTIATAAGMRQARLQHSFPERFHHAFGLELDAFADTVLHDKAWPVSPDQCIHVQKVADAARLSCEIGTIVSLQDNSFV